MYRSLQINPRSSEWIADEEYYITEYFHKTDIQTLSQIVSMRVFDLMNIRGINAIRAEEIIVSLYRYLHPGNSKLDELLYQRIADQTFDFKEWRRAFRDLSAVRVSDLVKYEGINQEALYDLIDALKKAFFKSSEYDWRRYRYANYQEYLDCKMNRKPEGASHGSARM